MRLIRFVLLAPMVAALATAVEDPWKPTDVIQPSALAARLSGGAPKVKILYVGYGVLYRRAHIVGAEMAGPTTKPAGLERLKKAVAKLPRDRELIIYCGCCPWDHCPNIRPAFKVLHEMGFRHLKVVSIATNMTTDWTSKGYPVERLKAAQ